MNAHSDMAPASVRRLSARPLTVQFFKPYGEVTDRSGAPTFLALVGRQMPLTQVGAMGRDGRLLRSGEIVVRGSLVMEGNRKNLAATAGTGRRRSQRRLAIPVSISASRFRPRAYASRRVPK
jgi:hypothetical protein